MTELPVLHTSAQTPQNEEVPARAASVDPYGEASDATGAPDAGVHIEANEVIDQSQHKDEIVTEQQHEASDNSRQNNDEADMAALLRAQQATSRARRALREKKRRAREERRAEELAIFRAQERRARADRAAAVGNLLDQSHESLPAELASIWRQGTQSSLSASTGSVGVDSTQHRSMDATMSVEDVSILSSTSGIRIAPAHRSRGDRLGQNVR